MERVLVLDQSYLPISIVNWKKAIIYVAQEKVEVVKEYDRVIHSAKAEWKLPAVIRFITKFMRPRKMVKFSRQNVYARDRWRCQYCSQKFPAGELTYDHVIPKSFPNSPGTCWENIVAACIPCNTRKGNRTPQQARMRLRRVPTRPDWVPIFAMKISSSKIVPELWRDFCYGY